MCIDKTGPRTGTVALVGLVYLNAEQISNGLIDEGPGQYYLSPVFPGKLTKQRPAIAMPVLYWLGATAACEDGGWGILLPQQKNFLEDHIHHQVELVPLPAGEHHNPGEGNPHEITNTCPDLPGWLPADDAVFNGTAPAGAAFGYNVKADPHLRDIWPPIPLNGVVLEMHRPDGVTFPLAGRVLPLRPGITAMKYVVLSDLHLVPPGGVANGLDPADRLARAIADVNRLHADAAVCFLAGDLADRGEPEAYALLREIVAHLKVPVRYLLGNHDDRPTFLAAVPEAVTDPDGFVQCVVDTEAGRLIGLDTSEPGRVDGVVCAVRRAWLADRLAEARDRPVHIVLHHPPYAMGMPVDRIRLSDADAVREVLAGHPDVRAIIAGHVHRTSSGLWRGLPVATIPGCHYGVSLHLEDGPGAQRRLEGTAAYAVVLADGDQVIVHTRDYLDRHVELADGLFRKPRRDAA